MLKFTVFLFFMIFVNLSYGQILIDDIGDDWKPKIERSLMLIKQIDPEKYDTLLKYCNHITFWNGTFSTIEDSKTIMISQMDMNSNTMNNILCAIIHESYHLKMYNVLNNKVCEEADAYNYEIDFILKIPNYEEWLLSHALGMSSYFEKKCE